MTCKPKVFPHRLQQLLLRILVFGRADGSINMETHRRGAYEPAHVRDSSNP
jgi:hypothetical protein